MKKPIDFRDLDRYLSGEATPAERAELEQRAEREPDVRELLSSLRGVQVDSWDTDRAWNQMSARMTAQSKSRLRPIQWLAIAALLVVAVGVVFVYRARDVDAPATTVALQEYRTARGEQREIALADGSRVSLSANSRLQVMDNRTVQLEGEAFFEIQADTQHPFTVTTANARTRVLGTSFNVNASMPDGAVEVVVVTGRVRVTPNRTEQGSGAIIEPGQAARVGETGLTEVRRVDANDYTAWRTGRLIFRDASLAEVVQTLERWYAVQIVIGDEGLARARVSAFFERQSLEEVVDVLAETVGATHVRRDSSITFYRK
jgi:transmembrane sensor